MYYLYCIICKLEQKYKNKIICNSDNCFVISCLSNQILQFNFRVPPPLKYHFNLLNLPVSELWASQTDGKCVSYILGWHTCLQKDCDCSSKGKRKALKEDKEIIKRDLLKTVKCWRCLCVDLCSACFWTHPTVFCFYFVIKGA